MSHLFPGMFGEIKQTNNKQTHKQKVIWTWELEGRNNQDEENAV